MALGEIGQVSSMQMLWSCAPWAGMTTVGGAQRTLKRLFKAVPTYSTSAIATPKDEADKPTCWMKYETSAKERSMNLWPLVDVG